MGKGDEAGGDFHRRGCKEKQEIKNFSKPGKQKRGGRDAASFSFGSLFCQALGEQGARRHGEVLQTGILIKHGRHLTTNTGH